MPGQAGAPDHEAGPVSMKQVQSARVLNTVWRRCVESHTLIFGSYTLLLSSCASYMSKTVTYSMILADLQTWHPRRWDRAHWNLKAVPHWNLKAVPQ